jgi:hypothetical protein
LEIDVIKQFRLTPGDSSNVIKKSAETLFPHLKGKTWRFFRCISTSDLTVVDEPNIGWNIDLLER